MNIVNYIHNTFIWAESAGAEEYMKYLVILRFLNDYS